MKLDFKTIIGFVVIGVVAYLCRPLNDKIADVFTICKDYANKDEDTNEIKISGNVDGHDYVDLGLSVKWATCNIGATNPEECGDYFAWGNAKPDWCYYEDKLNSSAEIALENWGESWRMPTIEEFEELVDNCSWFWTAINGVKGYKIISNNGNWIFLPATGSKNGSSNSILGYYGHYWSSTLPGDSARLAYEFYFKRNSKGIILNYRYIGHTVRPVTE